MDVKNEIKRLWKECFNDSPNWTDLYFDRVFSRGNLLMKYVGRSAASSMQLLPYKFNYMGRELAMSYVSGACTSRRYRGQGFMSGLMRQALDVALKRGDALMALIPASEPLFAYYAKFYFEPVFLIKKEHYTSEHRFHGDDTLSVVINPDEKLLWHYFSQHEKLMNGRVVHSEKDFFNVLWDNAEDGGKVIAATSRNGEIVGLLFCVPEHDELTIKEIMANSPAVAHTLLATAMELYPGLQLTVNSPVGEATQAAQPWGMMRIVNVMTIFQTLAASAPDLSQYVKIIDLDIADNNHIFKIEQGTVEVADGYCGKLTNELDIKTLAGVLFNTTATGELFGLPAVRPSMSLMLE